MKDSCKNTIKLKICFEISYTQKYSPIIVSYFPLPSSLTLCIMTLPQCTLVHPQHVFTDLLTLSFYSPCLYYPASPAVFSYIYSCFTYFSHTVLLDFLSAHPLHLHQILNLLPFPFTSFFSTRTSSVLPSLLSGVGFSVLPPPLSLLFFPLTALCPLPHSVSPFASFWGRRFRLPCRLLNSPCPSSSYVSLSTSSLPFSPCPTFFPPCHLLGSYPSLCPVSRSLSSLLLLLPPPIFPLSPNPHYSSSSSLFSFLPRLAFTLFSPSFPLHSPPSSSPCPTARVVSLKASRRLPRRLQEVLRSRSLLTGL